MTSQYEINNSRDIDNTIPEGQPNYTPSVINVGDVFRNNKDLTYIKVVSMPDYHIGYRFYNQYGILDGAKVYYSTDIVFMDGLKYYTFSNTKLF